MQELLRNLDETKKMTVRLRDNKEIQVEGKSTVAFTTTQGKVRFSNDVQFVRNLAHKLLSVGQLLARGYSILFDDEACLIRDKEIGHQIVGIHMTCIRMLRSLNFVASDQKN